jgi:hypothetical protein
MSPLFGKKPVASALAEVLEDGEALMNEEFSSPKYRGEHHRYGEPRISVAVQVQPGDRPPFEAKMSAGAASGTFLKPGVSVQVEFDPSGNDHVELTDDIPAILARNPQLLKQP